MRAAGIDARVLVLGESLVRFSILALYAAVATASSLPLALLLLPGVALTLWRLRACRIALDARGLGWEPGGRAEAQRWYLYQSGEAGSPQAREYLTLVDFSRVLPGFLCLRLAGPRGSYRLIVWLTLLPAEWRRQLLEIVSSPVEAG